MTEPDATRFDDHMQVHRLQAATALAADLGHGVVDFVHLLIVDFRDPNGLLRGLLERVAEDATSTRMAELGETLERTLTALPTSTAGPRPIRSAALAEVLESLTTEAPTREDGTVPRPITWAEVLQAILNFRPHALSVILTIDYGLRPAMLAEARPVPTGARAAATLGNDRIGDDALDAYATDLTALARAGRLPDVVGRDTEIRRLVTALARKESNNAILVGEAGVGKTRIVEGLAQRVATGNVHPSLLDKRVLALDLGGLVAGTQYRGQFEERLKALLRDLKESADEPILFIDEIHQLLGLGQTSGAMDAANLMKPALARGELRCIGATTYAEFRALEKDAALARRFQTVHVGEPSGDQLMHILKRVLPTYESYHAARFAPAALSELVRLGRRYAGATASPAREVGLIDEVAASRAVTAERSRPAAGRDQSARPVVDITIDDVREVFALRTGVPQERLAADSRRRVLELEGRLRSQVFGQDAAIATVAQSVRRSLVGLSPAGQPRGVLFFAGPSGVGKTELAKTLAHELYDTTDSVIRLDMSEFAAETARNRLIGSDPGFVGFEEGGRLTEAVRRRPYSLILLDEFEKAHPSVWRLFLQVFDDGRLTDAHGRTVSFGEATIVLTSNVGARQLSALAGAPAPGEDNDAGTTIVREALLATPGFPPELISRLGTPIVFGTLGPDALQPILARLCGDLLQRTLHSSGVPVTTREFIASVRGGVNDDGEIRIEWTDPERTNRCCGLVIAPEVATRVLTRGLDPLTGARALRGAFVDEVETRLTTLLLEHGHPSDWPQEIRIDASAATFAAKEVETW